MTLLPNGKVLVAGGDSGTATLSSAELYTTTPSAPTGVTATAGDAQVTISWTSVSGATSYNIYWSTTSGVTKTTGTKILNTTTSFENILSYNNHAYAVTKNAMTWDAAKTLAEQQGGYLVTVNDVAENQFLTTNYGTAGYVIGYNDIVTEGTWVWQMEKHQVIQVGLQESLTMPLGMKIVLLSLTQQVNGTMFLVQVQSVILWSGEH